MKIGSLALTGKLVLAPLAGISDLPFRLMAKACGAALVFSEMISANGLVQGNSSTRAMLKTSTEERPVAFQLFGSRPEVMGEAAAILSELDIDIIDINMGCPVKKVVKRGAGSALLKDPALAEKIMLAVRAETRLPVTVKIRSGWDASSKSAPDIARAAESSGINAVIVHGRTSRQMFGGKADSVVIREVREAVSIPVIGNGDVKSTADAERMMTETGCTGVMIGRASLGNPWVFSPAGQAESPEELKGFLLQHIALIERFLPSREALFKARQNAGWYARGLRGAARFRKELYSIDSIDLLREHVIHFFGNAARREESAVPAASRG